jgi:hypothetical protein
MTSSSGRACTRSGPHGGEGTLTVPADKDDEWVDSLWQAAIDRFGGWIDNVVSETRKGRHLAPADDVRPHSAPGAEWVRYVVLARFMGCCYAV